MRIRIFALAVAGLMAAACAPVSIDNPKDLYDIDNDKPLDDLDATLSGPTNEEIAAYEPPTPVAMALPDVYDDLVDFNSPVKSQGRRGVCSIFSTTALLEHYYVLEGTFTDNGVMPDFSEQWLQWSAKFEVNSFPNSSGSNAYYNLQSIRYYGIPLEEAWPYETNQWGVGDDPECDGEDDQPTRCYTNGQASDRAANANPQKWHLPNNRYISTYDIKDFLVNNERGVVVGLTFFYQAWNHRLSDPPTNSDYWRSGFVTYPNQVDKDFSTSDEMRAGHSILILGFDENLEVPMRDGEGKLIMDANGNTVREKGFFIFKNSWGDDSFGVNNAYKPGYGYISQRYVREYGRARYTNLPVNVELPDGIGGGDTETVTIDGMGNLAIPDDDASGITSNATANVSGVIRGMKVNVDISHTWRGDLTVQLSRAGEVITLHDQSGGSEDDLVTSFDVTNFNGSDLDGVWTLIVSDNAALDLGSLNAWSIDFEKSDN